MAVTYTLFLKDTLYLKAVLRTKTSTTTLLISLVCSENGSHHHQIITPAENTVRAKFAKTKFASNFLQQPGVNFSSHTNLQHIFINLN